jgi:predicted membrane chloride channel (bestrophin family)
LYTTNKVGEIMLAPQNNDAYHRYWNARHMGKTEKMQRPLNTHRSIDTAELFSMGGSQSK